MSKCQHAAREGDENGGPGAGRQASLESKGKQRTGQALQQLRIILAHPPPVDTPLLSVQPLLSKCSCDIEWPSVGLEILMMTAQWYVLNKAVSAAQPGDPCGILTGSSVAVSVACRVGESS